ncbi:MAG: hypothetical protein BJBARM5_0388 [Candidatus Parvarchaeum acidophilus ARMAN-5]|uniref:Uncharacterized protein n=1 Tax=Candidatus Parvarchaeum acidophilus ARMAN-5 TaxID=662762 RepID=D6GV80_PARA5|nr:MAG: hypothetical protein BJBARM5_0388 [Candidatus Parvarchaeum acidophilus ARMAN-5]
MGALKIIFYIIVAIVVFSLISTYIIGINAPEVAGLIGQSVTSFFKGASSNNTFVSNGENFSYPGNWLIFSPSVVTGVPILSQNSTISHSISSELTNSSIAIIFPNSYVTQIIGDIPGFISGAVSKNLSLGTITKLIKNVNVVVVTDFPLPTNLSNGSDLTQINDYLKGFDLNGGNSSSVNVSGTNGFLLNYKNVRIPQIDNLSFADAKIAIAVTGKTVCMVFGLASENTSLKTVDTGFDSVLGSVKCKTN